MEPKRSTTRQVTKIILARLDEEGVAFSDLLQEIRERLAKQYLRENYTVEQITYLLGFSEPSVFRKAFKKWSGVTPKEFRESSAAYSPGD